MWKEKAKPPWVRWIGIFVAVNALVLPLMWLLWEDTDYQQALYDPTFEEIDTVNVKYHSRFVKDDPLLPKMYYVRVQLENDDTIFTVGVTKKEYHSWSKVIPDGDYNVVTTNELKYILSDKRYILYTD